MNKLEKIKLEIGDKITFDDGSISYSNGKEFKEEYVFCKSIVKIERYEKVEKTSWVKEDTIYPLFILKTIYEKKEILTEKEKEYLRAVIEPFRDKILNFKLQPMNNNMAYMRIKINIEGTSNFRVRLDPFTRKEFYKGMELDKEYRLEDLGL